MKKEILMLIKERNFGKPVSFNIIDRIMLEKGIFGGALKKLIDSYCR